MPPKGRAGHQRTVWFVRIFHHGKIARPHIGIAGRHHQVGLVHHAHIRWFIGAVAEDRSHQVGEFFHIGGGRPTADQTVAQITAEVWAGHYVCHRFILSRSMLCVSRFVSCLGLICDNSANKQYIKHGQRAVNRVSVCHQHIVHRFFKSVDTDLKNRCTWVADLRKLREESV